MSKLFWILSLGTSLLAALFFVDGVMAAQSAPQQASAAAQALGVAVIPYCVARAVQEIGRGDGD